MDNVEHGLHGEPIVDVELTSELGGPFRDILYAGVVGEDTELGRSEDIPGTYADEVVTEVIFGKGMGIGTQQTQIGQHVLFGIGP